MNAVLLVSMLGLVALDLAGQLLLKRAADAAERRRVESPSKPGPRLIALLMRLPTFYGGIGLLILWYLGYLLLLAYLPVGQVFPMQSLGVVLILLTARIFLKEKAGTARWAGAVLISAGVLLLST